jgi:hypothetical protein
MGMKTTLWRRRFVGIVAVLFLGCALIGCAGSSKKAEPPAEEQAAEQKGSLSRTFTLTDEQGRKAGTLTVHPFGGAVLRDADGAVIKEFQAGGSSAPQPAATPSESAPAEAETETKTDG